MTDLRLLAVFAHPDDEAFRCGGTLALLARCGVSVQALTATWERCATKCRKTSPDFVAEDIQVYLLNDS